MIRCPRLGLVLCMLSALGAPARATKPCPEAPCDDAASCAPLATWIVVGRLVALEHHPAAPPVGKDFVAFAVLPERWDKGGGPRRRLRFQVGWCNNRRAPPAKLGQRVRVYGSGALPGAADSDAVELQYVFIEAA